MNESAKRFVIKEATRKRCKIVPWDQHIAKRFRPICLELFPYLKQADKIDFSLFFRNYDELIEFIKPNELSQELIEQMWSASIKPGAEVEVCLLKSDYGKFEAVIDKVRSQKIKSVLEKDRTLDENVTAIYSTLSSASQMIVRGGINNSVANKAISATAELMNSQIDSEIAVGTLSRMINCDSTLYDHSASVAMLSAIIATNFIKRKKMTRNDCEVVAQCGLYHDAGKSCVPNHVLNKPGKFTPEEFEIMKTHTLLGHEELLKAIKKGAPIDSLSARVALEHHERFTGKGYPHQKKGRLEENENGIHLYTRIVSIADVYSALLMKRVYKESKTPLEAISMMDEVANDEFDPEIFEPFKESILSSVKLYEEKEHKVLSHGKVVVIGKDESFSKAVLETQQNRKKG